jgi:hypothetical protein
MVKARYGDIIPMKATWTLLAFLLAAAQVRAELALPHIISDNMVLQRDNAGAHLGKGGWRHDGHGDLQRPD